MDSRKLFNVYEAKTIMTYPESVIIILPIPSRILSPNVPYATIRGRFANAAATKKYRRLARVAIEAEYLETMPWRHAEVRPVFYFATNRRRDTDNAMASLKSAYDGIVDSGLVKDDTPEYMTRIQPEFRTDKDSPRVEVEIVRVK